MEPEFEIRDVAQEKLGGPVMSVLGVDGDRVKCIWSTKSGSRTKVFKSSELRKLDPHRPRPRPIRIVFN
jgi:uncharacterized protein YodC (DUF2158 family)